ncbi:hypothetical protein Tco_1121428 [Tanacetum coccineum]|uniref:Uncharacterized protein n=1 Tax=Tanacetum coccineum TaxID=301880 RepID=A0ABQ5J0L6_9ASTR
MEYLPQTFWSQRDKANARAMIQAIDKRLKTRRIMRSLERFVGGRTRRGDLLASTMGPLLSSYVVLILQETSDVNSFTMKMQFLLESNIKQAHGRFNTTAGNPVKKILLKLNLSDHRFSRSVKVLKLKNFRKMNVKAFQEWYEHVGPEVASPQVAFYKMALEFMLG